MLPLVVSCGNEKPYTLDQKAIDTAKGSFTITKAYSLLNDTIVLPKHFKLIFNGGLLGDGVIFSFFRMFTIPSNTHFTINNRIELMPTNQGAYFLFWEYGKKNVTIDGKGTIAGDAREHIYTTPFIGKEYYGEWGMLFNCFKCRNFVFRDVTLTDAFGDCLLFQGAYGKSDKGNRWSDGLIMDNVTIRYARRNGVAIGARNVHIKNCTFECCGIDDIRGTRPRSAIDFEADGIRNYPEIGNENVVMEDCTFRNNFSDISACRNNLANYGRTATLIKNCVVTSAVKMSSANWVTFENCTIPTFSQSKSKRRIYWNCTHLTFRNCSFGIVDREVLNTAEKYKNSYKNCSFAKIVESK